jgi:peptide/nickel transport system permease protein
MTARIGQALAVLIFVSVFVFVILRFSGDPANALLPADATPEQRASIRTDFGLDQPLPLQFVSFIKNLAQGNFGISFVTKQPAMESVLDRLPATVQLTFSAMLLAVVVGVPLGVLAASRKGKLTDVLVSNVSLFGQALPTFWVGQMLILFFAVRLGWLPTSGGGFPEPLVLPAVSLSLFLIPQILLLVRSGMLETLSEGYIQVARAKGMPKRLLLFRHALRNVLIPIITVVGLNFGTLLGGAVVTESVFAWPGVGLLALQSITGNDFPVVQSAVIVLAVGVIMTNLFADLLYGWADPRIRVR